MLRRQGSALRLRQEATQRVVCPPSGWHHRLMIGLLQHFFPYFPADGRIIAPLTIAAMQLSAWTVMEILVRAAVGRRAWLAVGMAVAGLVPWYAHHQAVLAFAGRVLSAAGNPSPISGDAVYHGPLLVAAILTVSLVPRLLLVVVAAPAAAFLTTWYLTMPAARAAMATVSDPLLRNAYVGTGPFEGVLMVWLWAYLVGLTGLLLAYTLPLGWRASGSTSGVRVQKHW